MTRYRWDGDHFVDRKTGEPMETPDCIALPSIMRDVHYRSPLSRAEITSRSQRREEMKRHGVREVDPSEFTPTYNTKRWAERMKGEHDPRPKVDLGEGYVRPGRDELPENIRRTIEKAAGV